VTGEDHAVSHAFISRLWLPVGVMLWMLLLHLVCFGAMNMMYLHASDVYLGRIA
jgi:hypothetical protein